MSALAPLPGKKRTLAPVRPNAGIAAAYRAKLDDAIRAMHTSTLYWIRAAYRRADPATVDLMAQDEAPMLSLDRTLHALRRRWERQFRELADSLAEHFAKEASQRSAAALKKSLRNGGFSVKFRPTAAMKDAFQATVSEQVGLIRSIPQKYLTEVEGMVARSVAAGRDLGTLTKDLQHQYGVTRRRAALIARDQNNKATATMTRVRQAEAGINLAIWRHSHAGKKPRPEHVQMDGKEYDVRKGMYDRHEGKWIWPGELINCRCYSAPVIPGF